ncbi:MAG: xanthine dehydrogenase family protein molybdopterin-binding subunit [Bacteroidetes bacterium]|nr:xanthine dehydrogenase family protein molybdopterin-binding subunit [Bacteroidota bacterium]
MKKEKSNTQVASGTTGRRGMERRDFFKLVGGGVVIFFLPRCSSDPVPVAEPGKRSLPKDYNAFLKIDEDGTVNCYTGKIEQGQGIIMSLVQIMADDLNVPMEKIKMVMGDTELCPWDGGTWGSMTIRSFGPNMRRAAAEAKGVLLELAANKLKVPATQLVVVDGVIFDPANPGKSVTYGELAKGKKIEKFLDVKPEVEDYSKFTFIGKSFKRNDAKIKVTGEAKYTGDLKLPGMLFARILRPKSLSGKLASVDYSEAEKVPGTTVVRDGELVGVLNANLVLAGRALEMVKAEYTYDEIKVDNKTIFEAMIKADTTADVETTAGDIEAGFKQCDKIIETEIHDPFLAHAFIEPHSALAQFENDKLTVWASSQTPYPLQDALAKHFSMPLNKVRVIVPFVGGGFGGKSKNQQAMEAAILAKVCGKPVMVTWTREEEFLYDNFHSAGVLKIKSGIDKSGLIKAWDYHAYFCGTRGSEIVYDVPNHKITAHYHKENTPQVHILDTGPWRAPNNNTNTLGRELQIDRLAAAAKMDPLEFRLKNLKDQRMIDTLKAAADLFGYVPSKKYPSGRGIGIAVGTDVGTLVAEIAEIEIDKKTGKVKVKRIVCAQDMGLCVNPHGATMQLEGCITMALGYTFSEEIRFEGGNIIDRNYDTYELPRFSWVPKIESIILQRMDQPPHGGGEPAIIAVGAVVGNAIFDATGARLFQMPYTPERVLEALKKG